MRIGMITGEYPPMRGGVGDFTRLLSRAMVDEGHEVFILTDRRGTGLDDPGITVAPHVQGWNTAFFRIVKTWTQEYNIDIVNLQYETAAFNMSELIHLLPLQTRHVPYVTTFHDLLVPYLFPKAGFIRNHALHLLARLSKGIITTNPQDEQTLRKAVHLKHLTQIPIAANLTVREPDRDAISRIRKAARAGDNTLLIGHFGFINKSKGIETLLAAVNVAGQQYPTRLMMIGERIGGSESGSKDYLAEIETMAENAGVEPYWTGFVDDEAISDYFAAADIIVLPFRDGASLRRGSLQAALAFGRPTVTTRPSSGSIPELVEGDSVIYFSADGHHDLASILVELAENPEWRRRLGQGAQAASRQFDWKNIASRTLTFFQEIIAQ